MSDFLRRVFTVFVFMMITLPVGISSSLSDDKFKAWLDVLRTDALTAGISENTVNTALANVELREKVVKYDRNQPEFKLTYPIYLKKVVTAGRVAKGKRLWAEHKNLLEEIGLHYGVQPRFIVALW